MINELTVGVETTTGNPLFDGTVKQMFLDNSLRGGMPTIMGNVDSDTTYDEDEGVKVFHAFSRIHGDLERDYNAFSIEPAYFSQVCGTELTPSPCFLETLLTKPLPFRDLVTTVILPKIDVMM